MQITIFSKKRFTKDGKPFYGYISTLTKKDGTSQTVSVKFRDSCGSPKPEQCPMNIVIDKKSANLSYKKFVREDTGETVQSFTLWVSSWEPGEAYLDHSLDDYE